MLRFAISEKPLDGAALSAELDDPAAGGLVVFEGRVRNHNEGHAVTALEYEAYGALAVSEGERILTEIGGRHAILHAVCVHRTGALTIGDMAVWVGVAAAHRGAAFAACREVIDEIKARVPIWKKEFYANGDTGWVNCAQCAESSHRHRD